MLHHFFSMLASSQKYLFLILLVNPIASASTSIDDEIAEFERDNVTFSSNRQCIFEKINHKLSCSGGFIQDLHNFRGENVERLFLHNWLEQVIDLQFLQWFPSLLRFSIIKGNLTSFTGQFPAESSSLMVINITNTSLEVLPQNIFFNLSSLRVVDLRYNSLAELREPVFAVDSLSKIYLFGNQWRCNENATWILNTGGNNSVASKIVDRDKLRCTAPYEGRMLLPVLEIILALKEECKRTVCECQLVYIVSRGRQSRQLMAFSSVNCSQRGLTEMPEFLPANTTTLHLQGNKIASLAPLVNNPVYKKVLDLYINDNAVETIALLEGSYWLDHFRVLSLVGNKLTDLPTYALQNVLLQNGNAVSIYLGNNPWTCDCLFTPSFQDLLMRHTNLFKDVSEVKCSVGSDNAGKQVCDLTRTEICIAASEEPLLHPIDILNIILTSLIFLIVGKLLYDYWWFKRTGKLPWIVAKLP